MSKGGTSAMSKPRLLFALAAVTGTAGKPEAGMPAAKAVGTEKRSLVRGALCGRAVGAAADRRLLYFTSKRSRFITLLHAATKSRTKRSFASSCA